MKPPKMVSMEYDDEDSLDAAMPIAMPERPQFPYGLNLTLSEKELGKLGLDPAEAEVGGMVHGHFMACIRSVSKNDTENGESCRVELQIERLAIESEDEENAEADDAEAPQKKRRVLYG